MSLCGLLAVESRLHANRLRTRQVRIQSRVVRISLHRQYQKFTETRGGGKIFENDPL